MSDRPPVPSFWAFVIRLFRSGSPSTILGRIRTIVVDSIYRKTVSGTLPHVCQETLVASAPSVADPNAASAVVLETVISGTVAAILHGLPNHVFWVRAAPTGPTNAGSVLRHNFAGALTRIASARVRITTAKIPSSNNSRLPAITPAQPRYLTATVMRALANGGEASKTLPCQILKDWHRRVNHTLSPAASS